MPRLAWDNAAHSLLERTLDDSANRRTWLPEAFLTASELIEVARKLISGLQVNRTAIERNLLAYGPFAATERVLMGLAKAGADRQEMHSRLRQHALTAWQAVQAGGENPLIGLVISDPIFQQFLPSEQIRNLFDITQHTGDAAQRARNLAAAVQEEIKG
jgi:adenylosuccinate lyase